MRVKVRAGTSASEAPATLGSLANTELILGVAGIGGTLFASTVGYRTAVWLERREQVREDHQERRQLRTQPGS